jgi:bifunctional DNA-binding transcriptional regulator/antitoxin component of YhaV-PrlF toxin-antitoxin module
MSQAAVRGELRMERKIISISVKRQVTIPQKYFEALGFNTEAECILQEGGIFIRPIRDSTGGEFSEQILADLITQGFSGQELLDKFKEQSNKIRPAVQKLIDEADVFAQSGAGKVSINELLGSEE